MKCVACIGLVVLFACAPSTTGGPDGGGGGGADASPDDPDFPDAPACTATNVRADESTAPVDIIWVVDSSGSMSDEEDAVQDALNDFSAFIASTGINYHVILIGDAGSMNVPPPLGGSPEFLHVNQGVSSTNALEMVHATYSQYQSFLRDDAILHIVVVTDDESDWSHSTFNSQIAGLVDPGLAADYTLHSICSEETVIFTPPPPLPPIMGPCSGGIGLGGAAEAGLTYIDMTTATGGVWRSICTTDWDPVFMAVAEAVSVPIALPCTYDIPPPPEGENLDPNRVNFVYTPSGGSPTTVPRVESEAACAGGQGWYYDDPVFPTQILLCPATCTVLGNDGEGEVDIQFGCATVVL